MSERRRIDVREVTGDIEDQNYKKMKKCHGESKNMSYFRVYTRIIIA